jgi:bifunctional oligoribonuclease and PAP phosphatase NrnA
MKYSEVTKITELVESAQRILILQADNPDADSLASALALEEIFSEQGKYVNLYCSVDMPSYLRYLFGWDRVSRDIPSQFDISIIVDASTETLFSQLSDPNFRGALSSKPCIVLDHHEIVQNPITFSTVELVDPGASSTGELIYHLSQQANWNVNSAAGENLLTAVLGDTQGLTNSLARPDTYRMVANLIELGVDRQALEERRRESSKMPESIFRYKAILLDRTEFYAEGKLAIVSIPQKEIHTYSPLYNPAPLIQGDHLQTENVQLSVVMKHYDTGRITAAIRANYTTPIANKLAEEFNGGGHPYSAGFKIEDGRPFSEIKSECIKFASALLDKISGTTT